MTVDHATKLACFLATLNMRSGRFSPKDVEFTREELLRDYSTFYPVVKMQICRGMFGLSVQSPMGQEWLALRDEVEDALDWKDY